MVAAAGETVTISVRAIVGCMAAVVVGIVLSCLVGNKRDLLRQTPFEHSPDTLALKAQELVQSFGYTDRPRDRAYGLLRSTQYLNYLPKNVKLEDIPALLNSGRPAALSLWYRQSPQYLLMWRPSHFITPDDPPTTTSGMVSANLDGEGRLLRFVAVLLSAESVYG